MASMDFFEAQDRARGKTWKLIVIYALAVVAIIVTIYLVVSFFFFYRAEESPYPFFSREMLWDPAKLLMVSAAVLTVILLGTLYKVSQLSKGGSSVAEMAGGRKVDFSTRDPKERRLVNVVEEMSIASGIPVPAIYILDDEEGINAFAAGFSSRDAAVGVTKGTVEQLTRDELQGVIAHEFSHIFNGDMRLNIRLIGILNGILVLHVIGMIVMRGSIFARAGAGSSGGGDRGGKGGGGAMAILVLGLALLIVGYIGMLFGRMIQAAVSRQREYLADAAAVQYTRNPDGIGGALRKIGGLQAGSKVENGHSSELSHMFFAKGLSSGMNSAFSTHPPLEKRIEAIRPSEEAGSKAPSFIEEEQKETGSEKEEDGFGGTLRPAFILAAIGTFGQKDLSYARKLLQRIPDRVRAAVHEPLQAEALCYGLLLHKEKDLKEKQLNAIREKVGEEVEKEVKGIAPALEAVEREWILPLIDMALPALKQMSEKQYRAFRESLRELIEADDEVSVFEYALEKVLVHNLDAFILEKPDPKVRHKKLGALTQELSLLLSAIAHQSSPSPEEAWRSGIGAFEDDAIQKGSRFIEQGALQFKELDEALDAFAASSGEVRKQFLTAAVKVAYADGDLSKEEMELLRAMAEAIDCPMPISGGA